MKTSSARVCVATLFCWLVTLSALPAYAIVFTNILQLRSAVTAESRSHGAMKLSAVVCAVNSSQDFVVLADESGADLLRLESGCAL